MKRRREASERFVIRVGFAATVAALIGCVPTIPIGQTSRSASTPDASILDWTPPVIKSSAPCPSEQESTVDLVVAIDTSASTRAASGIDVDRDGTTGVNPRFELVSQGQYPSDTLTTDPGDTILAAETSAVRSLLGRVPFSAFRVSLITFGGEVDPRTGRQKTPRQHNAYMEVHLTAESEKLAEALRSIERKGSGGATDFSAAVRLATHELTRCTRSDEIDPPLKVVLFLTDGIPTFPFGKGSVSEEADGDIAVREAEVAGTHGIQIHTFALGPNALARPEATMAIAETTGGSFTPVVSLGALDTDLATAIGLTP